MNRRHFFKVLGALGAAVALHQIESDSADGLAQTPVESGWRFVAPGLLMQWGMSDDTGAAVFPLAMEQVFTCNVVGDSPIEKLTTTYAITAPRAYWLVMGFLAEKS